MLRNSSIYYNTLHQTSSNGMDDGEEMLWKLVDEAETNLVAYSEEVYTIHQILTFYSIN